MDIPITEKIITRERGEKPNSGAPRSPMELGASIFVEVSEGVQPTPDELHRRIL